MNHRHNNPNPRNIHPHPGTRYRAKSRWDHLHPGNLCLNLGFNPGPIRLHPGQGRLLARRHGFKPRHATLHPRYFRLEAG